MVFSYLLYAHVVHTPMGGGVRPVARVGGAMGSNVTQATSYVTTTAYLGPIKKSCRMSWPSVNGDGGLAYRTAWVYIQATLGLLAPSIVILTSYALLYCRLRTIHARRLRHRVSSTQRRSDGANSGSTNGSSGGAVVRRSSTSTTASRRMTLTVFTVVVTFIACQAPNQVNEVIGVWGGASGGRSQSNGGSGQAVFKLYWNAVSQILTFVSSCTNPFIYGMMNENYRKYANTNGGIIIRYILSFL